MFKYRIHQLFMVNSYGCICDSVYHRHITDMLLLVSATASGFFLSRVALSIEHWFRTQGSMVSSVVVNITLICNIHRMISVNQNVFCYGKGEIMMSQTGI